MNKAFPLPGIEFPLAKEVPNASKEGCHYQKKRDATARKIALLSKLRRNYQSKSNDSFTKNQEILMLVEKDNPLRKGLATMMIVQDEDSFEASSPGIKREFSNTRTPQHNGVAERRNMTLIEAARTMLADAKLPVTFWAEVVNTACYVQNKVLKGAGPNWLFDIDTLTNSMNYVPVVVAGTSSNFLGTKHAAKQDVKKDVSSLRYIALPNWFHEVHLESSLSKAQDASNPDTSESSGNSNPTATSTNPPADHIETLTVETLILIVMVIPLLVHFPIVSSYELPLLKTLHYYMKIRSTQSQRRVFVIFRM
nr:putative ribonuclease H-like domain-containing protein [Tanacetum cinerariifolium]